MGANSELGALQKEVTRQRILEASFRLFAEQAVEKVKMTDIADAAGVGVATVYRYYSTKPKLAVAVSTWAWDTYLKEAIRRISTQNLTAAERFAYFLDAFLDLYRNHRALLRFNQFFNVYIENEKNVPSDTVRPFLSVIEALTERFDALHRSAQQDGTLRTDVSAKEMMLPSLHLMLAAATRYAVGLVYTDGHDPERELILLRNMLLREYTQSAQIG